MKLKVIIKQFKKKERNKIDSLFIFILKSDEINEYTEFYNYFIIIEIY